jgi:alkylation response protein AidB-like acyl-CoA dehydrogenase
MTHLPNPTPLDDSLRFLSGRLRATAEALSTEFDKTASERDKRGGNAKRERDMLRESGLLGASVAREFGGAGATWPEILDLVRLFARVDSSLAHLYGFQHLMLATLRLFGSREQWEPLHAGTVEHAWFWGNALNPLDPTTQLAMDASGSDYVLSGSKSFSSGSVDSERLIVSATDAASQKLVVLWLPTDRPGVRVLGDWDNMGQRQTDSGGVRFTDVRVHASEVLTHPGPLSTPFACLRPLIAQLILSNVYLGIAEGAWQAACTYTLQAKRAWITSGVASPADDPYVLARYGEFFLELASARALADQAAVALQASFEQGEQLSSEQRGATAVRVAAAKVASSRAALNISSGIFEVMGARATSARLNFDRYWRNARTHTLHDPIDYKLRELGEFSLLDRLPRPTFYS